MKAWAIPLLVAVVYCTCSAAAAPAGADPVASMERKLRRIQSNSTSSHPQPVSTEFTEDEINDYFAAKKVNLPAGVQSILFQGELGVVTATTRVDFERVKSGHSSFNPLLEIFSGVHDVVVVAHARGAGGVGYVEIDSVSLDGVEIPKFVLQLFVEKYVQPRYPGLGLDSKFSLPDRIDSATVGAHELTVMQK